MLQNVSAGGRKEISTTAECCVLGPHVTLRIHPPHLDPPADPSCLLMNLTFVSVFGF